MAEALSILLPLSIMTQATDSKIDLTDASALDVLNVNGDKVRFRSLFESQKTIAVFIRSVP